jgi:hypothetical protein
MIRLRFQWATCRICRQLFKGKSQMVDYGDTMRGMVLLNFQDMGFP